MKAKSTKQEPVLDGEGNEKKNYVELRIHHSAFLFVSFRLNSFQGISLAWDTRESGGV